MNLIKDIIINNPQGAYPKLKFLNLLDDVDVYREMKLKKYIIPYMPKTDV